MRRVFGLDRKMMTISVDFYFRLCHKKTEISIRNRIKIKDAAVWAKFFAKPTFVEDNQFAYIREL